MTLKCAHPAGCGYRAWHCNGGRNRCFEYSGRQSARYGRAVAKLTHAPDHILVDGNRLPDWSHAAEAVIGGDARAPSIAAASIIAKHTRDEMMVSLDEQYPGYHWAQNKGYGVPAHREGLEAQGVSPEHRRTFAPIRRLLEQS